MNSFDIAAAIIPLICVLILLWFIVRRTATDRARSAESDRQTQEITAREIAAAAAIRAIQDSCLVHTHSRGVPRMAGVAERIAAGYWERLGRKKFLPPDTFPIGSEEEHAAQLLLRTAAQAELDALRRLRAIGAISDQVALKLMEEVEQLAKL